MSTIKLSAPATREFWEIPVLFEDEHLLALDKPARLLSSPDGDDPNRPNLMTLLHAAIAAGKPWASERGLTYLSDVHRLDAETSGVLLLAKNKPALIALADLFGAEKAALRYVALVHGTPAEEQFAVNAKIGPHAVKPGEMRVDAHNGKRASTQFTVLEKFPRQTLLRCEPLTARTHQIRVHLSNIGLRIVGDELYGGKPLWLSRLKPDYRLKPGREERPLLAHVALHAEQLAVPHPVTGETITITSSWPKDLNVALKYLRLYAARSRAAYEPLDEDWQAS
jgi:RluA family pseudouridine synthase